MVEKKVGDRVIRVVRGDITDLEVDAFVYDVTADGKLGAGYGGAIATRGGKVVQDELNSIGPVPTGEAVVTTAGKMKARFIIHLNGPKFHEPDTRGKLTRAVESALKRADEKGLATVAFPPIGTGLYQVPLDVCATVLFETVKRHLEGTTSLKEVLFDANDSREYKPLAAALEGGR
ncbi:MAG: macro domain-containing protein [Acidithiobacillales bacterium]